MAHYNVCQHRGARIMVNDMGWVKNFVCPYHGWEYGNDGTLAVVPDEGRFPDGVPCEEPQESGQLGHDGMVTSLLATNDLERPGAWN